MATAFEVFSTPVRRSNLRSTESPMEIDYPTPKFLNSNFISKGTDEDQHYKKRTHYEAMEVDTPPPRKTSSSTVELKTHPAPVTNTADPEPDPFSSKEGQELVPHKKTKVAKDESEALDQLSKEKFTFQVHHHHNTPPPLTWFQSETPQSLLVYLQFASFTLLLCFITTVGLFFLHAIYADIQAAILTLEQGIRAEIRQCAKDYADNKCNPDTNVPLMQVQCNAWEQCMAQPMKVEGKTKVIVQTIAKTIDSFVEVISFRTMFFIVILLATTIYITSFLIKLIPQRSKPMFTNPPYLQDSINPKTFPRDDFLGDEYTQKTIKQRVHVGK